MFHPCYPKQFNISINLGKDVFDSPCTKDYRPAQFDPEMSVTLVGTGNYQNCLDNVTEMFSFNNCSYTQCSFNGVFQPSVRGRFMVRELLDTDCDSHSYNSTRKDHKQSFIHTVQKICYFSVSVLVAFFGFLLFEN